MKKINFLKVLLFSGLLFFISCSDDNEKQLPRGDYENGILVSGEGSGAGTGSVSFISNDLSNTESKIYNKVNGTDLGTFLQSLAFDDDKAYIIVDNQNTITVVDRFTFEKLDEINEGLENPRYMTVIGSKGYITNWGKGSFGDNIDDDFIAVVDLNTFKLITKIDVAVGPERITNNGDKIFVSHKGAYGTNNKISVIDADNNNVEKVIDVKFKPDEMDFTANGNLIVLSGGNESWTGNETVGSIATINTTTLEVSSEVVFPDGVHPELMVIEGNTICYSVGNDVYMMSVTGNTLPQAKVLTAVDGFLYGIELNNGKLYALDASFTDISKMNVFNLSTITKETTLDAPLGASKIYFN